jgi:hypothetical protein
MGEGRDVLATALVGINHFVAPACHLRGKDSDIAVPKLLLFPVSRPQVFRTSNLQIRQHKFWQLKCPS